ncbi:transcription antitermination protein NusB [Candidatus Gottesmanbacteria bacterium]|nr:transcription antitermination protein NusB [Candidatus Gottesmanbacteria bacterium]
MKKVNDPRHLKRVQIVQALFAESFQSKNTHTDPLLLPIYSVQPNIDTLIESSAPQFPLEKIAKIDVAILRLAIYELLFEKKEPEKVIIDEAVELGKEFGGDGSPSFINGVLGTLLKRREKEKD